MSGSANYEEAAFIAAEFVSSIDNLHHEIQFLLNEIKEKDAQATEIQARIQSKTASVFRTKTIGALNPKEQGAIAWARSEFDALDKLAEEKTVLAQQLFQLSNKACGRLDHDLAKVRIASGETAPVPAEVIPLGGFRTPLVNTMHAAVAPPAPHHPELYDMGSPSPSPSQKRRKVAASASIPSPASASTVRLSHVPTSRSRLGNQLHPQIRTPSPHRRNEIVLEQQVPEEDPDADEGDEGGEGNDEDDQVYCFCQTKSHGTMVACDNEDCEKQWFHLPCVGLKEAPEGAWWCSECVDSGAKARKQASTRKRKNR